MAKRQRKEKPTKMEQKKIRGLEWEPHVKQTALLASPIDIGQAWEGEDKTHKKRKPRRTEPLPWGRPIPTPRGCTFVYLPNKTELLHGPLFQIFAAARQNQWKYTFPLQNEIQIILTRSLHLINFEKDWTYNIFMFIEFNKIFYDNLYLSRSRTGWINYQQC